MGPLSRWAVNRPKLAVGAWVAFMAVMFLLAGRFAGEYNDSFSLPDTESKQAQDLLEEQFGGVNTGQNDVKIVFSPESGTVTDPVVAAAVAEVLAEISEIDSVESVTSPFDPPAEGAPTPEQLAQFAGSAAPFLSPISADETVAYASATFTTVDDEVPTADVNALLSIVEEANAESGAIQFGVAGSLVDFAGGEPPASEGIGILVALIILAVMFGSVVAAGLPILVAIAGLASGLAAVTFFTQFADIATFAPTLASMIGLGVGIDYSLFVINRYKLAVDAGRDTKSAALEAVNTSGRAVAFAATVVVIALGGLFVLGINFINGLAIASMLTVVTVALAALWLLPAVLSWMGTRAFAWKLPWARKRSVRPQHTTFFARYGEWVQKRPALLAIAALVIMLIVAIPALSLRQGFADASGKAEGTPGRIGYDLLTEGWGPGINGPFLVVVDLAEPGDLQSAAAFTQAIAADPGVAGVTNPAPSDQANPEASEAALITLFPTSGPQDEATEQLLERLRTEVIPPVEEQTGAQGFVGGSTAIVSDFGTVLSDALPLFLAIVVGLGFLALGALFRAVLVSATGVLASLLSFGAALGVAVAVFQWGWLADLFGVANTGPIAPFLPVFLFAILFGLSMDYHVFLVSRMREEWGHSHDNHLAVRRGLAGSGRVVAAAALIMASVFFAFVLGDDPTIKLFGLSLGTAVLLDAFVVRLILIPALMTLFGRANWWLPGPLDRLLPHLEVEADEASYEEELAVLGADGSEEPATR